MSGHEGYQIEYDDEAPVDVRPAYPLTPKVKVKPPPRASAPHSLSSPALSSTSGSEFSGSLSVGTSKSVPSLPSVETPPPSRMSLRSRSKASRTTTTDDRTTVSEPSNPKNEDSDSTYSEQSPLVRSPEIPLSDDDAPVVQGFACFGKIMATFAICLLGIGAGLVAKSLWNRPPDMPEGFVSNTTVVFDSDLDMA